VAAGAIPRIRVDLDARALVPINEPALAEHDAAASLFHVRDTVVVGVVSPRTVVRQETLGRIARLTRQMAALEGISPESVLSIATLPLPQSGAESLVVRPLLDCGRGVSPDDVRRVEKAVRELGLNDGTLLSRDSAVALIAAEVRPESDRRSLLAQLERLAADEKGDGDDVVATGTALAQATLGDAVARDLLRLIPAVLAVIAVVLGIAFRRVAPPCISLVEIGLSLLWTAGILGLARASIFVTTLIVPVILITVGVSDDVHVLRHYYSFDPTLPVAHRIIASFSEMARAVVTTAASTIVGLMSMAITPLAPLRVFGIYGSLAIAFSTLLTFTLVPALLVLVEQRRNDANAHTLPRLPGLDGSARRLASAGAFTLTIFALVVGASLVAIVRGLRVDDRWIDNLPASSAVARADGLLNARMGGSMAVEFGVDGGRVDALLTAEGLGRVRCVERAVGRAYAVSAVTSVAQEVDRIRASLRGTTLAKAQGVTASDADVAQAMLLLSSLRSPALERRVDTTFRFARVTALVHNAHYPVVERIHNMAVSHELQATCGPVRAFGEAIVSYETVRTLVAGQLVAIPVAVVTDVLLLTLLLKSASKACLAVTPVVASGIIIFGAFAISNVPVGIANSMFTGIALGAGTDFSIHLLARRENPGSELAGSSAVLVSALAMAAGFAVLCLSRIQPTAQLGAAMSLTVIACGMNAVLITGAFAQDADDKHKTGASREEPCLS